MERSEEREDNVEGGHTIVVTRGGLSNNQPHSSGIGAGQRHLVNAEKEPDGEADGEWTDTEVGDTVPPRESRRGRV